MTKNGWYKLAEDGWPIKGLNVLVWTDPLGDQHKAFWDDVLFAGRLETEAWFLCESAEQLDESVNRVTHWRPLPPGPYEENL